MGDPQRPSVTVESLFFQRPALPPVPWRIDGALADEERPHTPVHGWVRPFLLFFFLFTLLASTLFWEIWRERQTSGLETLLEREGRVVEATVQAMGEMTRQAVDDLLTLAQLDSVAQALSPGSDGEAWVRELFASFLNHQTLHHQIRLIDQGGMERIKLEKRGKEIQSSPQGELEFKGDRYYFQEAMHLHPGEVYLSPMDLAVDHGQLRTPHFPVVRLVTPLVHGEEKGVLLLSLAANHLLTRFQEVAGQGRGRFALLDANGFWLRSPDRKNEFAFMFGGQEGFASRYPRLWPLVQLSGGGHLRTPEGLLLHRDLQPLRRLPPNPDPSQAGIRQDDYFWKVISLLPWEEVDGVLLETKRELLLLFALTELLGGGGLGFLVLRQSRRKEELERSRLEAAVQRGLNRMQALEREEKDPQTYADRFLAALMEATLLPPGSRALLFVLDRKTRIHLLSTSGLDAADEEGEQRLAAIMTRVLTLPHHEREVTALSWKEVERVQELLGQSLSPWLYLVPAHSSEGLEGGIFLWSAAPLDPRARSFLGTVGALLADHYLRLRMEEHLLRLYRAVEQSPVSILITDLEGKIEYVNGKFIALTGFSREEAVGANPRLLKSDQTPPAIYQEMWRTLKAGREWQGELINRRKDGSLFTEFASLSPIRNQQGEMTHFLAIKEDVTERKRIESEQRKLEQQLRQAQKMEAIGLLTGGIAHDFNNILAAIVGYSELALVRFVEDPESKLARYLRSIHAAGERARDLISQMLAFSRGQESQPREVSPEPILKEVVKLMRATLPASISIAVRLEEPLPRLWIDPVQFHQILMNLFVNARDAQGGKGAIHLTARLVTDTAAATCRSCHGDFCLTGLVEIALRDEGPGIPEEQIGKIFEPFFTTKEVGKGTGLGLSVVHGNLHAHGGHLLVETAPGRGACFRLFFPVHQGESAKHPARRPGRATTPGGEKRILVVDDEHAILDLLTDLLNEHGHSVVATDDSLQALRWFEEDPYRFDAVITDQTMPLLTGVELAERMLLLRPGLPVILCTGYSQAVDEEKARRLGLTAFFHKPVSGEELATVVAGLAPAVRAP